MDYEHNFTIHLYGLKKFKEIYYALPDVSLTNINWFFIMSDINNVMLIYKKGLKALCKYYVNNFAKCTAL